MGAERAVRFPAGSAPDWPAFAAALGGIKLAMIDGLPAFPDELPEPGWRELRLAFPAGMVTLRRGGDVWRFVVWGNSDAGLLEARDAAVRAAVALGGVADGTAG